ncbi:ATPase, T2SS/T4P/T4SS family, partial [Staphylococcus pasteuri]|uniref:ATPase, T2SS/T4P/T4SS family n=1 Tax=Staphylococcus pasteuri TaxID=45972 RepID=UPI0036F25ED2
NNQPLFLFTPPPPSPKSTLIYQILIYPQNELNLNLISIQHPLQQILKPITQISLNNKPPITYPTSFKPILRSHPHLILIPQIRHPQIPKYLF